VEAVVEAVVAVVVAVVVEVAVGDAWAAPGRVPDRPATASAPTVDTR
jgi:hypothetical protein